MARHAAHARRHCMAGGCRISIRRGRRIISDSVEIWVIFISSHKVHIVGGSLLLLLWLLSDKRV